MNKTTKEFNVSSMNSLQGNKFILKISADKESNDFRYKDVFLRSQIIVENMFVD